ncbi:hypothetical protein CEXT_57811 [Caerostris extrusa]|uniref:Uncharacterized protein n=1 Tax=Caerostris extrusa TaxID=172846 RepID=A0AAV4VGB1_CAEEX|nr:hypothetical protein CEXT_57811 [Caerostris extrusa]
MTGSAETAISKRDLTIDTDTALCIDGGNRLFGYRSVGGPEESRTCSSKLGRSENCGFFQFFLFVNLSIDLFCNLKLKESIFSNL